MCSGLQGTLAGLRQIRYPRVPSKPASLLLKEGTWERVFPEALTVGCLGVHHWEGDRQSLEDPAAVTLVAQRATQMDPETTGCVVHGVGKRVGLKGDGRGLA